MEKKIFQTFREHFEGRPVIIRSPGRINIIGEHTDYNGGFVLPAAIDKAAYVAVSLRQDDQIHLIAEDLNENFSTSITDLKPTTYGSWPNYILGAFAQFVKKGITANGFNAVITSEIPIGAGLSSSAAIECAIVFAFNHLLNAGLSKMEMVRMAQTAEHEYAGVMCGIMDQFASVMGKKNHVIKLNCDSLSYEYIPFNLQGIQIVLFDTNVKHSLASSAYNNRRNECSLAVEWVQQYQSNINSLSDVDTEMLEKYVLPKDDVIYKRGKFIVEENSRLQRACNDLQCGDVAALGKRMFETHDGLSKMYEVSCTELDFLVDAVRKNDSVIGARMMGGGFGGCTINLVKEEAVCDLQEEIAIKYHKYHGKSPGVYKVSIGEGTHEVF